MKSIFKASLFLSVIFLSACGENTQVGSVNFKGNDVQDKFCAIITKSRNAYLKEKSKDFYIDQKVAINNIFNQRKEDLKSVLGDGIVNNWKGKISSILISEGKGAFLEIELSCNTSLEPQDDLIIDINSHLYQKLRNYSENSTIIFSGNFLKSENENEDTYPYANDTYYAEKSFTKRGSIEEPEFLFKVTGLHGKK